MGSLLIGLCIRLQASDGEKSDQDLVVDDASEVSHNNLYTKDNANFGTRI